MHKVGRGVPRPHTGLIQDSTNIQSATATWISEIKIPKLQKKTRGKHLLGFSTKFHCTDLPKLIYVHIQTCKQQTYTVV